MSRYRFEDERYDRMDTYPVEQPSAADLAETQVKRSHDFGGLVHPEWLKAALDFHARTGRAPSTNDFPF